MIPRTVFRLQIAMQGMEIDTRPSQFSPSPPRAHISHGGVSNLKICDPRVVTLPDPIKIFIVRIQDHKGLRSATCESMKVSTVFTLSSGKNIYRNLCHNDYEYLISIKVFGVLDRWLLNTFYNIRDGRSRKAPRTNFSVIPEGGETSLEHVLRKFSSLDNYFLFQVIEIVEISHNCTLERAWPAMRACHRHVEEE